MTYEDFLREWEDPQQDFFMLHTSGSTGQPKPILLTKNRLILSAELTYKALALQKGKIYACLPLEKVGGFMQLVRSKVWNWDMQVVAPQSDPMEGLDAMHDCTFVSLVPFQLKTLLDKPASVQKLSRFQTVLIGGEGFDASVIPFDLFPHTRFYQTYGMTETYSHIALRELDPQKQSERFYPLPTIKLSINPGNSALQIDSPFSEKILQTQDAAILFEDGGFELLGRLDFVINSGGLKLHPETIEKEIAQTRLLAQDFAVVGIADLRLGQVPLLVVTQQIPPDIWEELKSKLPRFFMPHHQKIVNSIPRLPSAKIDRMKLIALL